MKIFPLIIIFLCVCSFAHTQSQQKQTAHFRVAPNHIRDDSCQQTWSWTINRKAVKPGKSGMLLAVCFPKPDTAVVINKLTKEKRIIISRFDPNHDYLLTGQGCDNAMEISDEARNKKMNSVYDSIYKLPAKVQDKAYDRADSFFMSNETPKVIFKLLNASKSDSVGGTFGEIHIGYTSGRVLRNNLTDTISEPFYMAEWGSYCYQSIIGFVSRKGKMNDDPNKQGVYFTKKEFTGPTFFLTHELFSAYLRFFNKEKILITYDLKKKKTKVEIIE
ncbi:MAG: hypothetical protein IAF38_01280 [Bacteroidia bacterium]|nr:hypothetical protein [Bacteroidia bacterium]